MCYLFIFVDFQTFRMRVVSVSASKIVKKMCTNTENIWHGTIPIPVFETGILQLSYRTKNNDTKNAKKRVPN
ncbi:hypothetical protein HanIR_Chr11g0520151 [Helianthus annuus]|nr:hypothetical protein HanIR_Chr11g0520151 [Helianthus annuus]